MKTKHVKYWHDERKRGKPMTKLAIHEVGTQIYKSHVDTASKTVTI